MNAYSGVPMDPYNQQPSQMFGMQPQYPGYGQQMPQQMMQPQRPPVDPRVFDTPEIVMGEVGQPRKPMFSVISPSNTITVEPDKSDAEIEAAKKKRKYVKKSSSESNLPIVRAEETAPTKTEVIDGTIYSYGETTNLLHETLGQVDAINAELVQEFNSVRHNRTMKNKYMVLNNLSENIGSMLSNRISIIKEINNCISKSNDMDYKKFKDREAAQSAMNDDKYIADIYQAFMQNPQNIAPTYNLPNNGQVLDQSVMGSGIVRATINDTSDPNALMDAGYMSYMANLTPEQNMMRYESDPNVKQVIVYDAQSGNRYFQVMNMATGEAITNVPTYDPMFLDDTTLDVKAGIARNLNLNETFPIVVINDNVTSQY